MNFTRQLASSVFHKDWNLHTRRSNERWACTPPFNPVNYPIMNTPTLLAAFGPLGTPELIIIAILVLVLFGAKKLPTFARSLGKSMGEFKKARDEFEQELTRAQEEVERPTIPATPEKRQPVNSPQDV
jgi:sec-independent protein translocase protein TatA